MFETFRVWNFINKIPWQLMFVPYTDHLSVVPRHPSRPRVFVLRRIFGPSPDSRLFCPANLSPSPPNIGGVHLWSVRLTSLHPHVRRATNWGIIALARSKLALYWFWLHCLARLKGRCLKNIMNSTLHIRSVVLLLTAMVRNWLTQNETRKTWCK